MKSKRKKFIRIFCTTRNVMGMTSMIPISTKLKKKWLVIMGLIMITIQTPAEKMKSTSTIKTRDFIE